MFSFRLSLDELEFRGKLECWVPHRSRWVFKNSWITPLANPALDFAVVADSTRVCAIARERVLDRAPLDPRFLIFTHPAVLDALLAELETWPGDYTVIEMQDQSARVRAGRFGTAPLYLAPAGKILEGSWNLPDLRHLLSADRLRDRVTVRALTRQHRYSTDTLFRDVYRLTERATASATPERFSIEYPKPAAHVMQPRKLRQGVDPIKEFDHLLTEKVSRYRCEPTEIGVELSGGVDSANVALSVARLFPQQVRSYGLIMPGDVGEQQRSRRDRFVQTIGTLDTTVTASHHPPFSPAGVRARGIPHDPAGAYYREAFDVLREAASAHHVRLLFTGHGGDELMALSPDVPAALAATQADVPWLTQQAKEALEEVDVNLAPVPPVPLPALMAFIVRNPPYLQAGIWPVAPLADPTTSRFAEQLPVVWRRNKALLRERLRRAGSTESDVAPSRPEHFHDLLQLGLRRCGLPLLRTMLDDSVLVDCGYVDPDALTSAFRQAQGAKEVPSLLCDTLVLETGLRSLLEGHQ
ncbi:hypothetical protein GCM10012275_42930 [Longimycelium tulufanense]|uniref:Asparagine synthetase domain-containing protein n=2 Tax=Longimycelium tulufanense TaxID=907463 RepID=A0A8J3CHL0_9PSEU|nr:hypothetical protein GCM10012275_42930 [Longimycelium tulufanense]